MSGWSQLVRFVVVVAVAVVSTQSAGGQVPAFSHVDLDGVNDYLAVADADDLSFGNGAADGPMTLEGWFRPDTMIGKQHLFSKWSTGSNLEYRLYLAAGTIRLDLYDGSSQAQVSANTANLQALLIATWHHVAATYDGRGGAAAATGITIYVDGVPMPLTWIANPSYVAMENGTAPLEIGRESASFKQFDGGLDELRVWNVARTQGQIQAQMTSQIGPQPNLVAYWTLNEGSGTTAADSALGGHIATLYNDAAWLPGGPVAPTDPDVTAPEISAVAVTGITHSSAIVSFTTNEITDGWVSLTQDGNCPCVDVPSQARGVQHSISVTGLDPESVYTFEVKATDPSGNFQSAPLSSFLTLAAPVDAAPPTVSITNPLAGSVLATVLVDATATDDIGIVGVQFRLDGVSLGAEDFTEPYSISWNTTTATVGPHTLTAEARDAAGNVSTDTVMVDVLLVETTPHYIELDGVNDYLATSDADSLSFGNGLADSGLTLEGWFWPHTMTGKQHLFSKWTSGTNLEYRLYFATGTIRLDLHDGSTQAQTSAYTTGSQTALIGGWHHIAVTYDGSGGPSAASGITIYVDGISMPLTRINQPSYVAMENGTAPLEVGRESTNFKQYDGGLDELRVWNVARTQSQIQAHMASQLSAQPGLVASWALDEGSGTTAADSSLGGHTLTLYNDAAWMPGGAVTPSEGEAAVITSAASATFAAGATGSFTVTATGSPTPVLSVSGTLPAGVTFSANANGTAALQGTPPPASGGSYLLTITATNGVGTPATLDFTLTVTQEVAITSAAAAAFPVGSASGFTVTTTGFPRPTLAVAGTLPAGVTFTSNGNGTATIAGTPMAGSGASYPLTITANGVGSPATQSFTLTITQPPAITSAASASFSLGTASNFSVTSSGFPRPSLTASGSIPPGITFTDNGNGTASLAGTPPPGSGGAHSLTITATNGIGTAATQPFTLTVDACALSPAPGALVSGTFHLSYATTFTVTGGIGAYVLSAGSLPPGLMLSSAGTISGTPTSTGTFNFTVSATNPAGCVASGSFHVLVAPNAQNESFSGGVGNTQYSVGAGVPATPAVVVSGTVLANDLGPGPLSAGPTSIATTNGGHVAMSPTGAFVYTPPPGFAGPADTFTYTVTDGNGASDNAVVTINLSGVVWYVNAAAGAGDGRSQNPFNNLVPASSAAQPGQAIYVHQGSPAGATTMKTGQTLWGAGAPFGANGLVIPATAAPTLQGTLTLANNVVVGALSLNGGAGAAIVANGLTGTEVLTTVSVTGGSTGLSLLNLAGTLSMTGGSITGVSSGPAVHISGGTGVVNIGASIVSSSGRSVDIQNRSAGTVTFTGTINDAGGGILLASNTGATIAFTGGLTLSTGANAAFTATGGGTVTAIQNNTTIVNTIASTSTALSVIGTEIGAAGLTFRSIASGSSTFSPGAGIILEHTGTGPGNGGLTVTGTGSPQSGGIIRRKIGPDGSATAGVGIYLDSTKNASFSWMNLNRFDNSAIVGRNVSGFLLSDSTIDAVGTTTGQVEGPIVFGLPVGVNGLQGAGIIRNTTITGGVEDNVAFYQHSGAMTLLIERDTVQPADCLIGTNSATTGARGLVLHTDGTAAASITINSCRIRSNRTIGLHATASDDSSLSLMVTGSPTDDYLKSLFTSGPSGGQDGIVLSNSGNADITATIENSIFTGFHGTAIWLGQAAGNASTSSMLSVRILANKIEPAAAVDSRGIVARFSSTVGEVSEARLFVANNTTPGGPAIVQYGLSPAILVTTPDANTTPAVDLTLVNNHVDMLENPSGSGIYGPVGISIASTQGNVCANILSNFSHWYPVALNPQGGGIRAEQAGSGTFRIERGSQPLASTAAAVLAGNNPPPAMTTMVTQATGAFTVVENGVCRVP